MNTIIRAQRSLLGPLEALSMVSSGLPLYYRSLTDNPDELIKVGAYCALIDLGALHPDQWDTVIDLSVYRAVQIRAFQFFESMGEYARAERVADADLLNKDDLIVRRMKAELAYDQQAMEEIERLRFLSEGNIGYIHSAAANAEEHGGWKLATEWLVRGVLLFPFDGNVANRLGMTLITANQTDLTRELMQLFTRFNVFTGARTLLAASIALSDKNPKACIKAVDRLPRDVPEKVKKFAIGLRAQAAEAQGQYREAYGFYQQQNQRAKDSKVDPMRYVRNITESASITVPELPDDPRVNHHMMVGFPRSGTTLLENALAAHPQIETFEEIRSATRMYQVLRRDLGDRFPGATISAEQALEARQRYYDEIDHHHRKADATCFVDKMPMRSGEAEFLVKFFPDKKYIFSIRHPYDVILSCFKQDFLTNVAMANFHDIFNAAKIYDFVMTRWFSVYGMDDERVHYIRYDDLVDDFEAETQLVCEFLGVPWDVGVTQFASSAQKRKVRTPSYAKVRKGLSIGKQSAWRNYKFIFESRQMEVLDKWLDHFGYTKD